MSFLANHLLQSTALGCTAALLALAFRNNPARTRHAIWMAASIKFLIPFSALIWLGSHGASRVIAPGPEPQLTFVMSEQHVSAAQQVNPVVPAARSTTDWRVNAAWAVYLCGSLAILARWRRRWAAIARAASGSTPAGSAHGVKILSSPRVSEPGVFGIFRPVLLLPREMEERLSPEQFDAVITHELAHVRRRDNLAAAIHMAVEALFWFHPLVWWIGARLVEERELACDEEVLHLGTNRETYAAGIIEVCQLCVEPPLACFSGITGADLKMRIASIMTAHTPQPVRAGKKALLTTLAICATGVPLLTGLLHPVRVRAQSKQKTAEARTFDVASVKLSRQSFFTLNPTRSGGRITWTANIGQLIMYAYHLDLWRISGAIPDEMYVVEASTMPDATTDDLRLMFQALLAERFRMSAHRATKEVDGWALTVAKGGPKIEEVKDGDPMPSLPEWFSKQESAAPSMDGRMIASIEGRGIGALTGRRVTMAQIAEEGVQRVLRTAVLDETGLKGKYYFGFKFARENQPDDVDQPSIFAALQEILGLKLEKRKVPVDLLVIDHIEKTPTAN